MILLNPTANKLPAVLLKRPFHIDSVPITLCVRDGEPFDAPGPKVSEVRGISLDGHC